MTIRSKRDTDRNFQRRGEGDEMMGIFSGEVDVVVSEEVVVSGDDSWEETLSEIGEEDHTFVYLCRKAHA